MKRYKEDFGKIKNEMKGKQKKNKESKRNQTMKERTKIVKDEERIH